MFLALLGMCAVIALSNQDFYREANVLNTTRQIAMLGIFSIGVSFVIISGGIDLSIGSIIGLSGVILARVSAPVAETGLVSGGGHSIWLGIAIALGVALLIGLIQGLIITGLGLQPFIVTLGGMLFIRGVSQTLTAGGNISFGTSEFRSLADEAVHIGSWLKIPYTVLIFAGVAMAAIYLLHFTVFGRHLYAIGGNRDAAKYSGIPVKRVETLTYVLSAGLAGLAGIPYAAYIGQMSHTVGEAYELYAITAAVLGGCSLRGGEGTVIGVIIGAAVMRIMDNGINMFQVPYTDAQGSRQSWRLDENWRNMINGGVILGAVILDQVTHILRDRRRRLRAGKKSDK
jgi:ribose transport system permease protein